MTTERNRSTTRRSTGAPAWVGWPDERLLDLRFRDLDLDLEGTAVAGHIARVHDELAARGIRFRPHYWLAEDWFTPDGVPGVAVPFYLAHPRLARLERKMVMTVEGGRSGECLRILRHELGHAIDNAFRLRRRRKRQMLFGKSSTPYPEFYTPRPYSREFVLHLDAWYAQSHPDEDFAETFAVWLRSNTWRRRYAGWPALRKLEYMDELMSDVRGTRAPVTTRRKVEPLSKLDTTLRDYYREKRERFGLDYPNFYDRDLTRLFSTAPEHRDRPAAARFIRNQRKSLRDGIARWTGTHHYTINQVLSDMIARCEELGLRLPDTPDAVEPHFRVLVTVHTMNYLHGGGHRIAL